MQKHIKLYFERIRKDEEIRLWDLNLKENREETTGELLRKVFKNPRKYLSKVQRYLKDNL